jgi:ribosomal-protein-alanine N-acetyltransferase
VVIAPPIEREMTAPAIELRTMGPDDTHEVAALEQLSFPHPWSEELFLQEIRLPYSKVILARLAAGTVPLLLGYVCRWIVERELHILNVAVHPDWRRRSIGRRLVEAALTEAKDAAALRATLEVRRHNRPALGLYERLGFTPVGVRRDYYGPGEDALLLERSLDDR